MKVSAPWYTFVHELEELFKRDAGIKVQYDEQANVVKIFVDNNPKKCDALTKLMPTEKTFGNITMKIEVVPSNNVTNEEDICQMFDDAFCGNSAYECAMPIKSLVGSFNYAVFDNRVVQFFNDNMADINGNKSMLYEDIARDVFGDKFAMFFCTTAKDKALAKPLGEWP